MTFEFAKQACRELANLPVDSSRGLREDEHGALTLPEYDSPPLPSRFQPRREQHGYLKVFGVVDNSSVQPQVHGPERGRGVPGDQ